MTVGARNGAGRAVYRTMGWLLGPHLVGIPQDPTLFLAELDEWIRIDAEPLLESIPCPTRIIGGAEDRVFPSDVVLRTAAGIPGAKAVIVPDVAHEVSPAMLTYYVAPFLAREAAVADTPRQYHQEVAKATDLG